MNIVVSDSPTSQVFFSSPCVSDFLHKENDDSFIDWENISCNSFFSHSNWYFLTFAIWGDDEDNKRRSGLGYVKRTSASRKISSVYTVVRVFVLKLKRLTLPAKRQKHHIVLGKLYFQTSIRSFCRFFSDSWPLTFRNRSFGKMSRVHACALSAGGHSRLLFLFLFFSGLYNHKYEERLRSSPGVFSSETRKQTPGGRKPKRPSGARRAVNAYWDLHM